MYRTAVRESGRRIALLVLILAAGAGASATGALADPAGTTHYPDLQTVIPTTAFSVAQGTAGREFRYTHLVYNAGPGPLEVQPQYNGASGNYQGVQTLFTHNAANQWSLVSSVRVPDAFVFHAAHGHFHFPLAAFGLYSRRRRRRHRRTRRRVAQERLLHLDDSYIYDSTVVHAGAFVGTQGSCADPTTLRGLTVGAADEYDYRDPGQAIPVDGVADGTYWFRAVSDPNNDFAEADESNNETDVKVTIAGSTVTAGQVLHPDTTPPPISWSAPADGTRVLGNVTLSASTTAAGGGGVAVPRRRQRRRHRPAASPYTLSWDSDDGGRRRALGGRAHDRRAGPDEHLGAGGAQRLQRDAAPGPGSARHRRDQERRWPRHGDDDRARRLADRRPAARLRVVGRPERPNGDRLRRWPDVVARAPREHAARHLGDLEGDGARLGRRASPSPRRPHGPATTSR